MNCNENRLFLVAVPALTRLLAEFAFGNLLDQAGGRKVGPVARFMKPAYTDVIGQVVAG